MPIRRAQFLPLAIDRFELRIVDGADRLMTTSQYDMLALERPANLGVALGGPLDSLIVDAQLLENFQALQMQAAKEGGQLMAALERLAAQHGASLVLRSAATEENEDDGGSDERAPNENLPLGGAADNG